jgi:hypothetical protein
MVAEPQIVAKPEQDATVGHRTAHRIVDTHMVLRFGAQRAADSRRRRSRGRLPRRTAAAGEAN